MGYIFIFSEYEYQRNWEGPVCDVLSVNNTNIILSRTVVQLSKCIDKNIALDRDVPLFNSLVRG